MIMKKVIHEAESRGVAYHGWLVSNHTFSFAGYHNSKRMNFGFLRVLNDNKVIAGEWFTTHPHENMEIISIPLFGELKHQDNLWNQEIIRENEVQAISAGSWVLHSEFNNSDVQPLEFLQLRIQTQAYDITPSYSHKSFSSKQRINQWQLQVSGKKLDNVVMIHQDAYISRIFLEQGMKSVYKKYKKEHGVYFFLIEGKWVIAWEHLRPRDGIGIEYEWTDIHLHAKDNFDVLAIEVPMNKKNL